jgi:hypothetical protein
MEFIPAFSLADSIENAPNGLALTGVGVSRLFGLPATEHVCSALVLVSMAIQLTMKETLMVWHLTIQFKSLFLISKSIPGHLFDHSSVGSILG